MLFLVLVIFLVGAIVLYLWKSFCNEHFGPFYINGGPIIEPVSSKFTWENTSPKKFRPFKPKYNLTMGINKPFHHDWLLLENTYLDRVNHHKAIFGSKLGDETCLTSPGSDYAVCELYDFVVSFLLARYPKFFKLKHLEKYESVVNMILNTEFPANSKTMLEHGYTARDMLRTLGENTEEDFLLLGFDSEISEYRLQACTGIAANGFLWSSRMGMKLTDLHGPVPEYKEKLQFSMNKFFRKMTPKDLVQRTTFKVQLSPHDALFLPDGNDNPKENVDFSRNVHMRLERQQLFRLPKSGFILFTIRTYMYRLSDIKSEGLGSAMAASIRSWPDAFAKYKHREEWGSSVLEYLEAN